MVLFLTEYWMWIAGYVAIGGILAGFFDTDSWRGVLIMVLLWPLLVLAIIGAVIRSLFGG